MVQIHPCQYVPPGCILICSSVVERFYNNRLFSTFYIYKAAYIAAFIFWEVLKTAKFNGTNTMKTENKSGHVAYKMDDKEKLVSMVLTTMFGEQKYYGDNTSELVQLAEKSDKEFLCKLAVYARKEAHLRSVSHALTAIIARYGSRYIKQTVNGVVERADDITEILSCYMNMYGKPIPNGLKRALAGAMNKFDEYQFAKYNGSKKTVKFRDVLRICHPKGKNKKQEELFGKIINDTLETPYTWEVELSTKGNTKETWKALIDGGKVGYMALLRNLRNILNAEPDNIDKVYDRLANKEAVLKSKQLPFRFLSAYKMVQDTASSKCFDVLEQAAEYSIENIEKIKGKTLIAIDVSGSMQNLISEKSTIRCQEIATMIGAMSNKICEDAEVVCFSDGLWKNPISSRNGIINSALSMAANGGGTNLKLPLEYALESKKKFDRMIMVSDNEINADYSWRDSGFEKTCQPLVDRYRKEVNKDFWVHAIDIMGYGTQQFIGAKTNIIAGWNERVLEFINLVESGGENLVKKIESYEV